MKNENFKKLSDALKIAHNPLASVEWEASELTNTLDQCAENEEFCAVTSIGIKTAEVKTQIQTWLHQDIL